MDLMDIKAAVHDRVTDLKIPKMADLISTNEVIRKKLKFKQAVADYEEMGGVVKVDGSDPESTKLVYPDKARLESQLSEIEGKISYFNRQIDDYKKNKSDRFAGKMKLGLTKFAEPVYWQHLAQFASDGEYRKQFNRVKPPVGKIKDARWGRVASLFVTSPEYRERLYEAKTSLIGRNTCGINDSIIKSESGTSELIEKRLSKFRAERAVLFKKRDAIASLLEFI